MLIVPWTRIIINECLIISQGSHLRFETGTRVGLLIVIIGNIVNTGAWCLDKSVLRVLTWDKLRMEPRLGEL